MKDNVLKKEFKEKDVQRLRNIVSKKYGEKTSTSVGFTNNTNEVYGEGDTWEEDGKTWTIKDGIKQNVTRLDKARETINFPIFCPSCKKPMKPHIDKKWFQLYQHCFNCQIDFETALRTSGQWETYQKQINNQGLEGVIKEFETWINEEIQNGDTQSYITEAGDVEKWVGSNKNLLLKQKEDTIKFLQSLKKD
jgi:hypothetical protein